MAASGGEDASAHPRLEVGPAVRVHEAQRLVGLPAVVVVVSIALPVAAPLAATMPVQASVREVVPPRLRRRRTAPMARTAASDAFVEEAVAVVGVRRRPTPALAERLGTGKAPHEPNDAGAEGQQDAQVVLALVPTPHARPVVSLLGAATWGTASGAEATQAEAARPAAEGVDSSDLVLTDKVAVVGAAHPDAGLGQDLPDPDDDLIPVRPVCGACSRVATRLAVPLPARAVLLAVDVGAGLHRGVVTPSVVCGQPREWKRMG